MALLRSGEAEFGKAELGKYSGPLIESADCRSGPIAHAYSVDLNATAP